MTTPASISSRVRTRPPAPSRGTWPSRARSFSCLTRRRIGAFAQPAAATSKPEPLGGSSRLSRQETILVEAAARIRCHMGLSQASKYERPLVFVVSKFDEWSHLISNDTEREPWRTQGNVTAVDVESVERRSSQVREILTRFSPEIVTAAESFARDVTFVAISSLGPGVQVDSYSGLAGIRPRDIRPYWAAVPLLYSLSRTIPALVPRMIRRQKSH